MKKLALLAIPAALALAFTTTTLAADGKTVYADNCAKCHGDDGKGATKMGQKLGAKDYSDAAVQAAVTDDQAFKAIKEGMKKDDKTLMKSSELSDEDIKASVAYLRTLKKERSDAEPPAGFDFCWRRLMVRSNQGKSGWRRPPVEARPGRSTGVCVAIAHSRH